MDRITPEPSASDRQPGVVVPNKQDSRRCVMEMEEEFKAVVGASPVENKILEQLHRQTALLVDMQRRVDDLTATVHRLTTQHGNVVTNSSAPTAAAPGNRRFFSADPPPPATSATTTTKKRTVVPPKPHTQQPRAAAPQAAVPPPQAQAPPQEPQTIWQMIQNSFTYKILFLFVQLRRRHVQELDGGLIFKILFMMAILSARMSSSSSGSKKFASQTEWHVKFAALVLLVVVGFLVQTGYVKYCYLFFVKENYPARVFDGESVQQILQHPQRQQQQQQQGQQPPNNNNHPHPNNNNNNNPPRGPLPPNQRHNNNNNNQGGGWRNTFLGGMIPEANQGGVVGAMQDVGLLLASFVMSIFPMWHPEAPRRPPPPQEQQEQGMAAPGQVAPPRNVLQAAEDDDDEDDNNNNQ
eukprot:Sro360_g126190.2  (409) ;mRNA; r:8118-9344